MWLKVGTRGDWRVIYGIIAFLIFLGLNRGYYQLYDLNDGPAKQKKIVREVESVMPLSDEIELQDCGVTEHIGGGRDFKFIVFSSLDKQSISNLFLKRMEENGWEKREGEEYFQKENMRITAKFIDESEYSNAKHLKCKTIFSIKGEIE
jgi:hypothetical protein